MNDKLIFSDGKVLYITLKSKVKFWVKLILVLSNLVLFGVVFMILYSAEDKAEFKESLFPVLMMSLAFYFIAFKPMLWNVFGSEKIIISKEQLSFHRDYGLYKTNHEIVNIENYLFVNMEEELSYSEGIYVLISFYEGENLDEKKLILRTGIKTPKQDFERIKILLHEIFEMPFELN